MFCYYYYVVDYSLLSLEQLINGCIPSNALMRVILYSQKKRGDMPFREKTSNVCRFIQANPAAVYTE